MGTAPTLPPQLTFQGAHQQARGRGDSPVAPRIRQTPLQPSHHHLPISSTYNLEGPDRALPPSSSLLSTAQFLDQLMKRRQDSGYLIEEIGDVLLARVRAPSPHPSGSPFSQPGTWNAGPRRPGLKPPLHQPPGVWAPSPVLLLGCYSPVRPCSPQSYLRQPPWPESHYSLMVPKAPGSRKSPPASAATSHLP